MRPRDASPYRLLVEGTDDLHTIVHLMARHGYDWNDERHTRPFVANSGGIDELLDEFPVALKGRYDRVGVLVDANTHPGDRWQQLLGRASSVGVELPARPDEHGTIVAGLRSGSRVGIWLMPDNTSRGTLESFLSRLVPSGDAAWNYSSEVVVEARRLGARCREIDELKSRLHSWLAWQEDPGLPFGTALRARVFAHDSEDALAFVGWFQRLFG